MKKEEEIELLASKIVKQLAQLETYFLDVHVEQAYLGRDYESPDWDDKKTYLFYGTRELFYKISLFLELKNLPLYLNFFQSKFQSIIDDKKEVTKSRGPLYEESEPSMIILDDFRDYLSGFKEFNIDGFQKHYRDRLKGILENTNSILSKTNTAVISEKSIYDIVHWVVEMTYPEARRRNNSRFVRKIKSYKPDILVPEVSAAIEYKMIRKGKNAADFLDQIKTDADNYTGDPEYNYFYAVVYFQDKSTLNQAAFRAAVNEKSFAENWTIIAL